MIETALQDPHLTPALRLSLVQRARRILQSKSVKKRKLFETEANSSSSSCGVRAEGRGGGVEGRDGGGVGRFSLEQFPELELLQAPEVSIGVGSGGGGGQGGRLPPPPKFQVGGASPPNYTHCLHNELHCSIVDGIAYRHYSSR